MLGHSKFVPLHVIISKSYQKTQVVRDTRLNSLVMYGYGSLMLVLLQQIHTHSHMYVYYEWF